MTLESEASHCTVCGKAATLKEFRVFFVSKIYEICADEAWTWTHRSNPPNRYWCFFGGIFGLESDLSALESSLRRLTSSYAHKIEVKWSNVSDISLPVYKKLLDEFFKHLESKDIKYRQLFLDRAFVYAPRADEPGQSDLDIQYKIYYQFLKHHFGLRYLPPAQDAFDVIYIRLDEHSSQQHTAQLKRFAENLPTHIERTDLRFHVSFVQSKKHLRLQICDLIMGAAGSYGNKMHLKRDPNRRGMSHKQKIRLELAKYIYEKLRAASVADRGIKSFNWFYSTGQDGDVKNKLLHKIRIWRFEPAGCQIDKGWQNDNLDAQGNYLSPKIVPRSKFTPD